MCGIIKLHALHNIMIHFSFFFGEFHTDDVFFLVFVRGRSCDYSDYARALRGCLYGICFSRMCSPNRRARHTCRKTRFFENGHVCELGL